MMKKNDIYEGTCSDYTYDGLGIVKVDGFSVFVKNVIIGETILFKLIKIKKNYGYGRIIEIKNPSIHRTTPFCEYFGKCGGCQLQHMDLEAQNELKENIVINNIRRIAHSDAEVKPILNGQPRAYRNKAQFPLTANPYALGFYRIHSNEIVDITMCPIQSDKINTLYQYLRLHLKSTSFVSKLRHILIKHAFHTDEIMLVFIASDNIQNSMEEFINKLTKEQNITSVILNVNRSTNNVILGNEEHLLFGSNTINESLMGYTFQIASKSFYQVNPEQTKVLYEKVLEYANITKNDTVIDLYCGVGSISLFLAKSAKQVIGIEIVEDAITNAKANAKMNHINNIEFVCSDAGTYAEYMVANNITANIVVLDPPRKGCDDKTIQSVIKMHPERIVYVSCNPATLARDIEKFEQFDYKCTIVQPVDMFPHTFHVETVCLMSRKEK
ncbi:23S rRNA (uracil1939-C5)-methyltransferase [Breznakia sp. PF5-3]|uniref:23S rRNA (uracil(1939)-C(5))-methyltransferase RlmD n=1 Tax=unclassified Breznakia TaxID=2623764 RepID=UPI002406DF4D|nr:MULTISPECIES: 23S rRNA (uracil(1939)-C(5))-methyltransferase RlmD [unclassified Breznakia]MDF9823762.1 23S rRNA (uracil1939-C5)-methyltransferase [Breznakia sp. PM6-1]MDF9834560.1 23S rRNA (uracil1939-C5)-methyltransferase [Breznakia sp. PF5-3]MDF9838247.1 23S rRNA (uracil1939-C5)-methyltransferase [Breznakia sp. PFB2-8]MDF9860263.1 23S rRNA (uracil1939-C5)-methyltransferase [Breznakia sp. PH5-24]